MLAFGLLSWTAAHELAAWLVDCTHATGSGAAFWPWTHHASSAAVVLGSLGAGSLLALLAAPPRRSGGAVPFAAVRSSALLVAGGFLAADTAGRVLSGDYTAPSLLVLLIGLGVHLLIAVTASALWHCWAGTIPWALWPTGEVRRPGSPRRNAMAATRCDRTRPRHWARAVAGRAPPLPAV